VGEHHSTTLSELLLNFHAGVSCIWSPTFCNALCELPPAHGWYLVVPIHNDHNTLRNKLMVYDILPVKSRHQLSSFLLSDHGKMSDLEMTVISTWWIVFYFGAHTGNTIPAALKSSPILMQLLHCSHFRILDMIC
jgi:hypothetical protein